MGLAQISCSAWRAATAFGPRGAPVETKRPNPHNAYLLSARLEDVRLGFSEVAPAGVDLLLRTDDVEIISDIGFEGCRIGPVSLGQPDIYENI